MQIVTSLVLSSLAVLLFGSLWVTSWWLGDCPSWLQRIGVPCDLFVGVTYFAICPTLALLAIVFATRDISRKQRRAQGYVAFCKAAGLLVWLWANPAP